MLNLPDVRANICPPNDPTIPCVNSRTQSFLTGLWCQWTLKVHRLCTRKADHDSPCLSAPSIPPPNVSVIITSRKVAVIWDAVPAHLANGQIRGYQALIMHAGTVTDICFLNARMRNVSFLHLLPHTTYRLALMALTVRRGPIKTLNVTTQQEGMMKVITSHLLQLFL